MMFSYKITKALCVLSACFVATTVFGQRIINVGLHVAPCFSEIHTEFPGSLKDVSSEGNYNFNIKISGKYYLNKQFGVASGFEFLGFKQSSSAAQSYESFKSYDSENKIYERRVWGSGIEEKTDLKMLQIPLQIFYQHAFNNAVAVYGSLGPGISIPVVKNNNGSGNFNYKGYYAEEKALLSDIPIYGFNSDVSVAVNNKIKTNPIVISIGASLGVELSLNRYYRFSAALGYYRTVTNVAKTGSPIHVSDEIGSYNSLINTGKNTLSNVWLSIGISKNILF